MADPTTVPTGIQPNLPAALSELGAACCFRPCWSQ